MARELLSGAECGKFAIQVRKKVFQFEAAADLGLDVV
jgi:hypothetical protein